MTISTIRNLAPTARYLVLAVAVAGCSSGASVTSGPSAPPSAMTSVTVAPPSALATDIAVSTPSAPAATPPASTPAVSPVVTAAATDQEPPSDTADLIPDEIAGMTLEKTSYTGPEYVELASGGDPALIQKFTDFFTAMETTAENVELVAGNGFSDDDYVVVSVFRVAGGDAATIVNATVQNQIDTAPLFNPGMTGSAAPETVGGKDVTVLTLTLGTAVYETQYLYGYGDAAFTVKGGSDEVISEALSKLP